MFNKISAQGVPCLTRMVRLIVLSAFVSGAALLCGDGSLLAWAGEVRFPCVIQPDQSTARAVGLLPGLRVWWITQLPSR